MEIAYVIPSYKRPEVLLLLLDNISRQSINTEVEFEILVSVDKSDPTLEQYKSLIKQIVEVIERRDDAPFKCILIENDTEGLLLAKNNAVNSTDARFIMMLDDDLMMEDDYVEKLYKDMKKDHEVGAISGYIVSTVPAISHTQPSDRVKKAPAEGTRLQTLEVVETGESWESLFGQKEQVMDWSEVNLDLDKKARYEMDYFVNSYMFRKELFERVNGYNDALNSKTSAHEEVDFTYRIGRSGLKLIFNPFARMWHITIGHGGIYKGEDWQESKKILDKEYNDSIATFLRSIKDPRNV